MMVTLDKYEWLGSFTLWWTDATMNEDSVCKCAVHSFTLKLNPCDEWHVQRRKLKQREILFWEERKNKKSCFVINYAWKLQTMLRSCCCVFNPFMTPRMRRFFVRFWESCNHMTARKQPDWCSAWRRNAHEANLLMRPKIFPHELSSSDWHSSSENFY